MIQSNTANTFGLPKSSIDVILAILAKYPEVNMAVLYGSRAMGTYKPGSDIDLTLQGQAIPQSVLFAIKEDLWESPIPYQVDLSIFENLDNPALIDHIGRVGKIFYSRAIMASRV